MSKIPKTFHHFMAVAALTILLFCSVNAHNAPTWVIISGLILLCVSLYYLFYGLLALLGLYGIHLAHRRQKALYLTILAGLLLALKSTGELSARDIWVLAPLAALGYFYGLYSRRPGVD